MSKDIVYISGKLHNITGLTAGTPIKKDGTIIGIIEKVDIENDMFVGAIDREKWDAIDGDVTLGFSIV